jgi:ribosomal protein S12 methylthiotransferase
MRVLYLQPEGMTEELIATIRDVPEVLPYIDIPIQHCSATVLERMGRKGSAEEFRALFAQAAPRDSRHGAQDDRHGRVPGRDGRGGEELLDFLQDEEFDYCSVFTYSPEEGTPWRCHARPGARRGQARAHPAPHRPYRGAGLCNGREHVGERVASSSTASRRATDGPELIGHAWFQAPDSDGAVHIESGEASVGDIVRVKLVDSFCYELVGELLGSE